MPLVWQEKLYEAGEVIMDAKLIVNGKEFDIEILDPELQKMLSSERHGQWLINPDGYYPYCSECGEEPDSGVMTKRCPNCGAKMDKHTRVVK